MRANEMRTGERGNILLAVVIVVLAVAGLAAAFVETGVQETANSAVAGERSRVGYIAETGVNEAMGELLTGGDGNVGTLSVKVNFAGGEFYSTCVDHGDGTFTVTSYGYLNQQKEAIEVVLAPEDVPLFSKALFGDLDLGASGNVFTDSYDSDLGTYASQATHNHAVTGRTYAMTNGHLGSNRNIFIRGGVTVLGNATPGPGYTVQVSGGSSYIEGSTAPAMSPTVLPPVDYTPAIGSAGNYSTSGDVAFSTGTYRYDQFSAGGTAKIRIQGDVILYVDDDLSFTAQAQLIIEAGGSLTVYHAGKDFSLTGGGMLNETLEPSKFRLFSRADDVKFSGNSTFHGAVYAPSATIVPTGTTDIFGSFVGRQIDVGGTTNFHYDEALSRQGLNNRTRLKKVSWRKIAAP